MQGCLCTVFMSYTCTVSSFLYWLLKEAFLTCSLPMVSFGLEACCLVSPYAQCYLRSSRFALQPGPTNGTSGSSSRLFFFFF